MLWPVSDTSFNSVSVSFFPTLFLIQNEEHEHKLEVKISYNYSVSYTLDFLFRVVQGQRTCHVFLQKTTEAAIFKASYEPGQTLCLLFLFLFSYLFLIFFLNRKHISVAS